MAGTAADDANHSAVVLFGDRNFNEVLLLEALEEVLNLPFLRSKKLREVLVRDSAPEYVVEGIDLCK